MVKNKNKILYLAIAAIFLSALTALYGTDLNRKTYGVSIYLDGDKSNLLRVADLLVEYDKKDMELISVESGGFLNNSSAIQKANWDKDRSLLMSTTTNSNKPILKLKFRSKNKPSNIKLSQKSILYLANIGSSSFQSNGITYRVGYEQ